MTGPRTAEATALPLAAEWSSWKNTVGDFGPIPGELLDILKPVFLSGALSVLKLRADGIDDAVLKAELIWYWLEGEGLPPGQQPS